MRQLFTSLLLLLAAVSAADDEPPPQLLVASGEDRVTLLELYTSEGCSSCPPADRWLTGLKDGPRLWKSFVPVALHVDYWDYIGWSDRFAQAGNGDRQRGLAAENDSRTVYTPGVFANGREWLGWRRGQRVPDHGGKAGNLDIRLVDGTLDIEYRPASEPAGDLVGNVGILGIDLSSDVRAGENRGRRLDHDFVLLGLQSAPLEENRSGGVMSARLTADATAAAPNALVAWVARAGRLAPLQAAGGFITPR